MDPWNGSTYTFLKHINSAHNDVIFIMEIESNSSLLFLGVMVPFSIMVVYFIRRIKNKLTRTSSYSILSHTAQKYLGYSIRQTSNWTKSFKKKCLSYLLVNLIKIDSYLIFLSSQNSIRWRKKTVYHSKSHALRYLKKNSKANIYLGFDKITGVILKNLPRKAIVTLINLINVSFRIR